MCLALLCAALAWSLPAFADSDDERGKGNAYGHENRDGDAEPGSQSQSEPAESQPEPEPEPEPEPAPQPHEENAAARGRAQNSRANGRQLNHPHKSPAPGPADAPGRGEAPAFGGAAPPAAADPKRTSGRQRPKKGAGQPGLRDTGSQREAQRKRAGGAPVRQRSRRPVQGRVAPLAGGPVSFTDGTQRAAAASGVAASTRAKSARADQSSRPTAVAVAPPEPLPARIFPEQVRGIVEEIPGELWAALAGLSLLAVLLAISSWLTALRARRLERQRQALLQEVGLLQAALLPPVPEEVPVSVAYRPAEGLAAGGDFYEALPLAGGQAGLIIGDVSGHGREALARTTLIRYTLRAYLEAGLEPREVVRVAGEVLAEHLGVGFATVMVAVHDPASGRFSYATGGHHPPLVVGPGAYEPVTVCSSPPLGIGEPTGFRQTTFTLAAGSTVLLYTDGLSEARVGDQMLGREGLAKLVEALPPQAGADELLEAVGTASSLVADDMAACLVRAPDGAPADGPRVEELQVDEAAVGDSLEHFLRVCGVPLADVPGVLREAGQAARRAGNATVRVRLGDFRPGVDVIAGNLVRMQERRRALRG